MTYYSSLTEDLYSCISNDLIFFNAKSRGEINVLFICKPKMYSCCLDAYYHATAFFVTHPQEGHPYYDQG